MKHIVSFSGGIGSYLAAKRVADKYGTDELYLVFTDVLIEDEDLYRFIQEAANDIGGKFVWITEGRNPWQVFEDVRFMGNTRVAHCSKVLKSKPFENWLEEQDFDDFTVYLGIDWTEEHRLHNHRKHVKHKVEAPLCEAPFLTREDGFRILESNGIKIPKLYELGFSHNNCGGGCVKAGQAQWARLYEVMPERYKWFEDAQEDMMSKVPNARPFLRMTIDKKLNYLTLKEFRLNHLELNKQIDMFDIGGCGCFME